MGFASPCAAPATAPEARYWTREASSSTTARRGRGAPARRGPRGGLRPHAMGPVEEALNAAGRTLPVLTSVPGATVGGTLSEGGLGARSLHQGAQVDHVERLRLVLADGTALWCGPGEEPDLFRLALAGCGQVGVLERVVLATLPSWPLTRLQLNPHGGLSELVEAVAWTETWRESTPEHFLGLWKEGRFWSVFGRDFADEASATRAPLPEPLARMTRERAELDAPPQLLTWSDEDDTRQRHPWRRRVWCDYCLDLEGLRGFARFLEGRPGWMSGLETVSLLGLANPPGRTRGPFDMRPPTQRAERLYVLGLYHGVDVGDGPGLRAAEALHQACLEWCVRAGGRPSPRGGSILDASSLRGLYAEDLSLLRTWRASRDPLDCSIPMGCRRASCWSRKPLAHLSLAVHFTCSSRSRRLQPAHGPHTFTRCSFSSPASSVVWAPSSSRLPCPRSSTRSSAR
ncbi:FAD-binding protein [Cystobacter fuscus]